MDQFKTKSMSWFIAVSSLSILATIATQSIFFEFSNLLTFLLLWLLDLYGRRGDALTLYWLSAYTLSSCITLSSGMRIPLSSFSFCTLICCSTSRFCFLFISTWHFNFFFHFNCWGFFFLIFRCRLYLLCSICWSWFIWWSSKSSCTRRNLSWALYSSFSLPSFHSSLLLPTNLQTHWRNGQVGYCGV